MASFPLEMRMIMGPAFKKYECHGIYGAIMKSRTSFSRKNVDAKLGGYVPFVQNIVAPQSTSPKVQMGLWQTNLGEFVQKWTNGQLSAKKDRLVAESSEFCGTWKFDQERSDPPGPQLKALGLPWWKRLIASQARPLVSVDLDSAVWRQRISFPILGPFYELSETISLDEKTQTSRLHGFKIVQQSRREGDKIVTRTLVDGKHRGRTERSLIEGGKTYYVESTLKMKSGDVVSKRSYFNRVA